MARLMALDVGSKTIGVAMTDELQIIASPFSTIRRTESIKADLRAVEQLVLDYQISKVIVGNPMLMSGEEAIQSGKVRQFTDRLARRLRIPVELWDERMSTVEAEEVLIETGNSREERKKVIDSVAAAVILRSYMDHKGNES